MRLLTPKAAFLSLAMGLGLASAAFGQTVVNFGVTGPGPTDNNVANVYTDPYTGCVGSGCMSNPQTTMQIYCDDFVDDVNPPQYWNAFATNLSQLPSDPKDVYFSGTTSYSLPKLVPNSSWNPSLETFSQVTDYIAAAILVTDSMAAGAGNPVAQDEYSFALWGIFDPSLLTNATNKYGTLPSSPNYLGGAQADMESALLQANTYNGNVAAYLSANPNITNVTIYSACTGCAVGQPGGTVDTAANRPQEFITVSMAEPPSIAVLGVYFLFGGAGLLFFGRRRIFRAR